MIANHEETPEEKRAQQDRETEEFFAKSAGRKVKQRAEKA